jgi:hypothetical protein
MAVAVKKCLKPKLFTPKVARLPHVTGAHGLRDRAFNTRSCGVEFPRIRAFLDGCEPD